MATKEIRVCDRCGNEEGITMQLRTPYLQRYWHGHVDMGPAGGYDMIELCKDCEEEFLLWLMV